ncbi:Holliday junction branch migration protein RuvA, partial [bacterium]|nr:Holliday junction branch migration protein RuvA [bacterium]
KGELTHKQNGDKSAYLTVETGGVGYLIETSTKNLNKASDIGTNIKIYTVLLHREDNMSLCGFLQREERDIFKILTSVSGVGPKMALMLLNEFESSELISFVIKGDFKELTRAKGVGPKLAQKIILELKDKLMNMQDKIPVSLPDDVVVKDEQAILDAQTVLISLGYEREEIKSSISKSLGFVKDSSNAEEVLKEALKLLSF